MGSVSKVWFSVFLKSCSGVGDGIRGEKLEKDILLDYSDFRFGEYFECYKVKLLFYFF